MSGAWHRRMRHARRWLVYGGVVLLVLVATLMATASQLLPWVARNPDQIAAWLGQQIGQPVSVVKADAVWTRRGPLFTLSGLHIGSAEAGLAIDQAQLLVSVYSGLIPGMPLTELRLSGTTLALVRGDDGRWGVRGLVDHAAADSDPLDALQGLGELQLIDAALHIDAPGVGIDFSVPRMVARMRVSGSRVRVGATAWADPVSPVSVTLDVARDGRDGQLYVGGDELDLAAWAPVLAAAGVELRAAQGRLSIWADLRERQIEAVRAVMDLHDVALRGRVPISLDSGVIEPRLGLDRLSGDLYWRAERDHWLLYAARLGIDDAGTMQTLDGLRVERSDDLDIHLREASLRALASLVALSDSPAEGLRRWLYSAAPRGKVHDVDFHRDASGAITASLRIADVGWLAAPGRPGIEGIAGKLIMVGDALRFEPAMPAFVFDWPEGFAAPIHGSLAGAILGWRDGTGWQLDSPDFALGAEEIHLDGQVRVAAANHDTPRMDIAVNLGEAPIVAAKRFWVLNDMSPTTVDWLNDGLVGGRIAGGQILISGPVKGWPYRQGQGRFTSNLHLADVTLAYHPDWPEAKGLTGDVQFAVGGFAIQAKTSVAGIELDRLDGHVADFRDGHLYLDLHADTSGDKLLGLVRGSPLNDKFGEAISGLSIGGKADLSIRMMQPLKAEAGEHQIDGSIDLRNAALADNRWDVAFARADGRIRFTGTGLVTDGLSVPVGDNMATLNVAVGDFTANPGNGLEMSLRGRMSADTLIDHYRELDWLRPWLQGQSEWTVAIDKPRDAAGAPAPTRLHISSDLVGTALLLPSPLRKSADQALPLDVRTPLPLAGGELQLSLGGLMQMRARRGDGDRLDGTLAFGRAQAAFTAKPGLSVIGEVPVLDMIGWAGFATGSRTAGDADPASPVSSVDLSVGQLDVLDRAFSDTRVQLGLLDDGVQLHFDGAQIKGTLDVPSTLPALRGRFDRLYWPSSRPAGESSTHAVAVDVPPLDFVIDDLRFGEAQLGQAIIKAYPTPEGLHIEQLQTRHPGQDITASGDWTQVGGASRSRFALEFRGDDIGKMLDALGFSGMIDGGKVKVLMAGSWPGSPADFDMRVLNGSLDIDVGAGRILDVEPGAGRMLGLISITQIPRRLLLDFSDIFGDGLGFNSLRGHFDIADGQARTDDLLVQAAAAEIRVRGRAGLVAQDYDQMVDVRPKAGSVFPAVGALAAGPIGIAVGALAQLVLQKPMKRAARTLYHVTGPWAAPEVKVVEKGTPDTVPAVPIPPLKPALIPVPIAPAPSVAPEDQAKPDASAEPAPEPAPESDTDQSRGK